MLHSLPKRRWRRGDKGRRDEERGREEEKKQGVQVTFPNVRSSYESLWITYGGIDGTSELPKDFQSSPDLNITTGNTCVCSLIGARAQRSCH